MSLEKYAETDVQREVVSLRESGRSWSDIAKTLNRDIRGLQRVFRRVEKAAAVRGYSPEYGMTKPVPSGFNVKGVSTLYDQDGNMTAQWVKSNADHEARTKALLEAIEDSASGLPKFKPTKPPKQVNDDLASLLTITDFHLGMRAWAPSDGEDWDVRIARDVFMNSINDMIAAAPPSGVGILNQLGDFFHFDSLSPVTPTNHHLLSNDDRYSKLVELTIAVMTESVHLMLKKFGKVVVVQAEGNHDLASSVWLRKYIKHRFQDEPRVEVIDNEFPYYAYQHGDFMLGFHHGHKMRMTQLQKLFASEPRFREMWGLSKYAYLHCGHLHHERVLEDAGCVVEMHPSLSSRDNYSSSNGYVSQRGAKLITYDKNDGEIHRVTVRPRNG